MLAITNYILISSDDLIQKLRLFLELASKQL